MVRCSVLGCKSDSERKLPDISFHSARAWAKYCWPNEDWTSITFLQSLHTSSKVLCGRHFNLTQFYDNNRQKLSKFAVPDSIEVEELLNDRENIFRQVPESSGTETECTAPGGPRRRPSPGPGSSESVRPSSTGPTAAKRQRNDDPEHGSALTTEFCRICFAAGCTLYPMTRHRNLGRLYETLTGLSVSGEALPSRVCAACARRLLEFARFRARCLQAHVAMLEAANSQGRVTLEEIKFVKTEDQRPTDAEVTRQRPVVNDAEDVEEGSACETALDDDVKSDAGTFSEDSNDYEFPIDRLTRRIDRESRDGSDNSVDKPLLNVIKETETTSQGGRSKSKSKGDRRVYLSRKHIATGYVKRKENGSSVNKYNTRQFDVCLPDPYEQVEDDMTVEGEETMREDDDSSGFFLVI